MAMDSAPEIWMRLHKSFSSASEGWTRMLPSGAVRSLIPKHNSLGTSGRGTGGDQLYKSVLAWRPMAIVSSNPAVVTKATREPLRSSRMLVPTVVPWRTSGAVAGDACRTASKTAFSGSAGVEKSFRTWTMLSQA